ncbi:type VI secretion system protein ImpE [Comamonas sp. BIGb0152]|uniref:type VI secretion system accessory protein TagJ n=1 Tax=Comamonas sp. BIGb0152 TaxID=2940601 RepID=UPI00216A5A2C|nr:type VI secretion system accessory protein TagJ [Comamonas sp. BIGb0152]MCS4292968.1 type VI secretion system protein ImpE [Comamonas sp. BIGb0152]
MTELAPTTLAAKITEVQDAIRHRPADGKLRVHLFQLYVQDGRWQKALAQLQIAAQLDSDYQILAQAYRLAIRAEILREDIFLGLRSPSILGQPGQWISYLKEALLADASGHETKAQDLRMRALDEAIGAPGRMDQDDFAWIADADARLGPVLEVFVNGGYYWLPFDAIRELHLDAPADLRDLVWMPAHITLVNEGKHAMLLPARYPLLGDGVEDAHRQSRITGWEARGQTHVGMGVKLLVTDTAERSILDIRHLQLDHSHGETRQD